MSSLSFRLCSTHGCELVTCQTQFGPRYQCPCEGCTVVAWSGHTSTPANSETRQLRTAAHEAFDPLWKSGVFHREFLYERLAEYMGLPRSETHIGYFDAEQCRAVLRFVNDWAVKHG